MSKKISNVYDSNFVHISNPNHAQVRVGKRYFFPAIIVEITYYPRICYSFTAFLPTPLGRKPNSQ